MRKILTLGALLGVICFVTTQANAQRPPIGGGMGGIGLLMNKGVQEELKMTDEQKEKIVEKRKGMSDKFAKIKELPKEEQQEAMQKMFKEAQEGAAKELSEILKPEQMKRLKQIERQQNITAAFADDDVKKELKITDEQVSKIKTINEEMNKEIAELFKQFNKENPLDTREKVAALRKDSIAKTTEVLTEDQKKKWKELVGEPFEVKFDGNTRKKPKDN